MQLVGRLEEGEGERDVGGMWRWSKRWVVGWNSEWLRAFVDASMNIPIMCRLIGAERASVHSCEWGMGGREYETLRRRKQDT